jgi:hypothetical protein
MEFFGLYSADHGFFIAFSALNGYVVLIRFYPVIPSKELFGSEVRR